MRAHGTSRFERMFLLLGPLVLTGAACARTVVLGSECPDQDTPCSEPLAADANPQHQPDLEDTLDAEVAALPDDAEASDAAKNLPDDAQLPVALNDGEQISASYPLVPLVVDNPSFERGGGLPGDVLLVSLIQTLLPLPPVTWAWTTLPHWYACLPLAVSSESRDGGDAGVFQSGGDYVAFVTNGTTVRQALPVPMAKGTRYSFALDVISRSEGSQNLFVEMRGARQQCGEGIILGRSPLLRDGTTWTSSCVSFVASDNFAYLLIGPGWEGAMPSPGARMFIDNLRQVENCAP